MLVISQYPIVDTPVIFLVRTNVLSVDCGSQVSRFLERVMFLDERTVLDCRRGHGRSLPPPLSRIKHRGGYMRRCALWIVKTR